MRFRFLILSTLALALLPIQVKADELPLLTTVRQIRSLPAREAGLGYPVRLAAVLTHNEPKDASIFVQDQTGGVYCSLLARDLRADMHDGQELLLEGITGPGKYLPMLIVRRLTVLGEGNLPQARPTPFEELITGQQDSQRVEVRGVVRSFHPQGQDYFVMKISMGGGRLDLIVEDPMPANLDRWVGGVVRAQGICGAEFNTQRQLYGVHLVLHLKDVIPEQPLENHPFEAETRPIQSVWQFDPASRTNGRIKVAGTVVHNDRGGSFYIEDQTGGMEIVGDESNSLAAGDRVEVLGFPVWGEYTPRLEDITLRRTGRGPLPQPANLTAGQLLDGRHNARLVRLNAELVDLSRGPEDAILMLKADSLLFSARLASANWQRVASLRKGSQLAVTGICLSQMGKYQFGLVNPHALSFDLQLRGPEDISLVKAAPWWTLQRLGLLLAGILALLITAACWVALLRHRVRCQTEMIGERLQAEAVLNERSRVAHELHDTVEQDLAAVALHLNVMTDYSAKLYPEMTDKLERVMHQVRRSQTNAHSAVWDLRSTTLTDRGLAAALRELLELTTESPGLHGQFTLLGQERRLSSVTEHHLLRLGGEALNNALRHASPRNLSASLEYNDQAVILRIEDDGCGFSPENTAPSSARFGIRGMRQRVAKIGARLTLLSAPGSGCLIEVRLPLIPTGATTLS